MKNLKELRAGLRKVNTRLKIKRYSDFSSVIYIYQGEEISATVFSAEYLEKIKPLIDFVNDHKDEIKEIFQAERLNGWSRFILTKERRILCFTLNTKRTGFTVTLVSLIQLKNCLNL